MIFLVEAIALADVVGRTDDEFRQVRRATKTVWIGILITAMLLSIVVGTRSLASLLGLLVAAYYFLDVRPRLQAVSDD
jgi:hypothetical protein